jgi:ABC-type multidrug transport system ATPase subunit
VLPAPPTAGFIDQEMARLASHSENGKHCRNVSIPGITPVAGSVVRSPLFERYSSSWDIEEAGFKLQQRLGDNVDASDLQQEPYPAYSYPDGSVAFHRVGTAGLVPVELINVEPISTEHQEGVHNHTIADARLQGGLVWTLAVNDNRDIRLVRPNDFARTNPRRHQGFDRLVPVHARLKLMSAVHVAHMTQVLGIVKGQQVEQQRYQLPQQQQEQKQEQRQQQLNATQLKFLLAPLELDGTEEVQLLLLLEALTKQSSPTSAPSSTSPPSSLVLSTADYDSIQTLVGSLAEMSASERSQLLAMLNMMTEGQQVPILRGYIDQVQAQVEREDSVGGADSTNGAEASPPSESSGGAAAAVIEGMDILSLLSLVSSSQNGGGVELNARLEAIRALRVLQTFPLYLSLHIDSAVESIGSFLYPLVLALPLPVAVYVGVNERTSGARGLMFSMGLSIVKHHAASFAFNLILALALALVLGVGGAVAGVRFFVETSTVEILLPLFVGWSLALASLALVCTAVVHSKPLALIVGYLLSVLGTVLSLLIAAIVYGELPGVALISAMPGWYLMWPQLALCRAVYLINYHCIYSPDGCPMKFSHSTFGSSSDEAHFTTASSATSDASMPSPSQELGNAIIALYFGAVVYAVIGVCIEHWPKQLHFGRRGGRSIPVKQQGPDHGREEQEREEREDLTVGVIAEAQQVAADVSALSSGCTSKWESGKSDGDGRVNTPSQQPLVLPLLVHTLFKTFKRVASVRNPTSPTTTTADAPTPSLSGPALLPGVNGLSLSIKSGECLGLLGKNGAGKTTLIKCITGAIRPDNHANTGNSHDANTGADGDAYIGGWSITHHRRRAQQLLGVCPQYSVLWDCLTVEEHVKFYAILKGGLPQEVESTTDESDCEDQEMQLEDKTEGYSRCSRLCRRRSNTVQRVLLQMGLWHKRRTPASNLSGGMQRRLSVACALVGDPALIVLDEPSSGLDPVSRARLWKALLRAKSAFNDPGSERTSAAALLLTTHSLAEARYGLVALFAAALHVRCAANSLHDCAACTPPVLLLSAHLSYDTPSSPL